MLNLWKEQTQILTQYLKKIAASFNIFNTVLLEFWIMV